VGSGFGVGVFNQKREERGKEKGKKKRRRRCMTKIKAPINAHYLRGKREKKEKGKNRVYRGPVPHYLYFLKGKNRGRKKKKKKKKKGGGEKGDYPTSKRVSRRLSLSEKRGGEKGRRKKEEEKGGRGEDKGRGVRPSGP